MVPPDKPQIIFCGFSCSRISHTTVQIIGKSVCHQIRNSAPFLSLPGLVDVLDVLRLRARCLQLRQQCRTCKLWTFLISRGPRPLDHSAHALNKGTKRWISASATHFAVWVGHTYLKILQTTCTCMPKTRPQRMCMGGNFFARPHSLGGWQAESQPLFSECP